MTHMRTINIATDYTRYPAGRFMKNGNTSGEGFRVIHLVPALNSNDKVRVEFDGTVGYGSSFLEEAFGGLVRQLGITSEALTSRLELVSKDKSLIEEVLQYIVDAEKALGKT